MRIRTWMALLAGSSLAIGQESKPPSPPSPPKALTVVEPKVEPRVEPKAAPPSKGPVKTRIVKEPDASGGNAKVLVVPEAADAPAESGKSPGVEAAIPSPVKALGAPAMMVFPNGIQMAVTAATAAAQAHVNQGMNHLHGGWEFEASRHFAAAMREDPECLLAHWGMVMSLLTPSPETGPARNAASDRLLDLVDAGKGTELERGFAYGLIKYMEEGPTGAASAFRKVAAKFPNDLQAAIFAALFSRTGYDELGTATPDQETAEAALLELIKKHPQSPLPLNALLSIRAEAPDLRESLPLARQLCRMAPDYPPYFHLLGHYEWRCGEHGKAASAFGRAATYFENWMKENQTSVVDCPEWVKAECYRIVSLVSRGDFDTAYAASRQIATTAFPQDRAASPGARILMWDAKTLPARILLHRGLRGNAREAMDSLPKPEDLKPYHGASLAYWWIDGLRISLEARRLIDAGDLKGAGDASAALTHHGEAMSKSQSAAAASGERSEWNRAFRALEVIASDIRGGIALAGPKEGIGSAYNWFSSAADRQRPATAMLPPAVLTPMALRIGDYFMAVNRPQDAIEAFQRALGDFPSNMNALNGLKNAFEKAGLPDQAAETAKQIEILTAQ